jgi:RNA polymerase sigma-70 factor (ECF subfamily)
VTVDEVAAVLPDHLRVLYDEHSAALWRYALRLTRDAHQAHDVVQETLLRAWRHPEITEDSTQSPRAWLFTAARNIIIDDRRTARFRNEVAMSEDADFCEPIDLQHTDASIDRLMVRHAVSQLSEDHRAVLWRAYYLGWTVVRIAEDLQLAEGTVKSRLHYALQALRRTLQDGVEPDGG